MMRLLELQTSASLVALLCTVYVQATSVICYQLTFINDSGLRMVTICGIQANLNENEMNHIVFVIESINLFCTNGVHEIR